MNIVCLNCEMVVKTDDPRKRFCGKVCKNRWNVKKFRSKPKKEVIGLDKLRAMMKGIEEKKIEREVIKRTPVWDHDRGEWA